MINKNYITVTLPRKTIEVIDKKLAVFKHDVFGSRTMVINEALKLLAKKRKIKIDL